MNGVLTSVQARVDQLAAELHDPATGPERQAAIKAELRYWFAWLLASVRP